ncbi:hypothetical protein PHYC_01857 [Phycisphaerales bacterium]|nr:hypothetical protein PHYC_01857 [Phycisphaerales bacterium]
MATGPSPPWGSTACAVIVTFTTACSVYRSASIYFAATDRDYRVGVDSGEAAIGWRRPSRMPVGGMEMSCERVYGAGCLLNWRPYHSAEAPFPYPSSYRYLRIPLWPVAGLGACVSAYRWGRFAAIRRSQIRCRECGYPLGGLAASCGAIRCPECGRVCLEPACERNTNSPPKASADVLETRVLRSRTVVVEEPGN